MGKLVSGRRLWGPSVRPKQFDAVFSVTCSECRGPDCRGS